MQDGVMPLGRQSQKDCKFKASLGYINKTLSQNNKKK
jgi:hypothetical protein